MNISKRVVAREWLICLALLVTGFAASFFLLYWRKYSFDRFFGDLTDRHDRLRLWTLIAAPYLVFLIIRSIWWSIKALNISKRAQVRLGSGAIVFLIIFPLLAAILTGLQHQSAPKKFTPPPLDSGRHVPDRVSVDDLKKITLFDVVVKSGSSDTSSLYTWLTGFEGRVRNDLPRAVEKIGLKASFYNAQGALIEVRMFWLQPLTGNVYQVAPPVFPNAPVSFKNENDMRVDRLPDGWKYQLEVIEAHYVQQ